MRFVIYTIYCIFMSKTHTGNHTATVVTAGAKRDQCSVCGHYMCVCVSTIKIAKKRMKKSDRKKGAKKEDEPWGRLR